jgi:hypothetical protein
VTGRFRFADVRRVGPSRWPRSFLAPAVAGAIAHVVDDERNVDVGDIVLTPPRAGCAERCSARRVTPVGADVAVRIRSLTPSGDVPIPGVGQLPSPVPPEYEVSTDEQGRFEFPLVLRGNFVLSADTGVPDPAVAADRASEVQTEVFADPEGNRLLNARLRGQAIGAVPKLPIGEFVTVDLRLQDVAGARVRVVENDGTTPVEGARVALTTASSLDDDPPAAFTDANGEIDLFPVSEGGFSVDATVPGSPKRGSAAGVVPVNPANGFEASVTVRLGAYDRQRQVVAATSSARWLAPCCAPTAPLANPPRSACVRRHRHPRYQRRRRPLRADAVPGGSFRVDVFGPSRRAALRPVSSRTAGSSKCRDARGSAGDRLGARAAAAACCRASTSVLPSGSFSDRLVTRTDTAGVYVLPGVPLGPYTVRRVSRRTRERLRRARRDAHRNHRRLPRAEQRDRGVVSRACS